MEKTNNVIILERKDLLQEFRSLPLDHLTLDHIQYCESFTEGDMENSQLVLFIDQYQKTRILKNWFGSTGMVTLVPQIRKITITVDATDLEPSEDFDMFKPEAFDHILLEYMKEISGRLDNVYGITLENIEIK